MCIVIDSNVFSPLVNPQASDHKEFQPVLEWIASGKGKVVYGGTTYAKEVSKHRGFRGFLVQMEHKGKTVNANCADVDSVAGALSQAIRGSGFNDHHIVSIVLVSGCKLVCSNDTRLHTLISICYSGGARASIKSLIKGISANP
ncbi:unnamed protein product, partial [marine sediment metagenome]